MKEPQEAHLDRSLVLPYHTCPLGRRLRVGDLPMLCHEQEPPCPLRRRGRNLLLGLIRE